MAIGQSLDPTYPVPHDPSSNGSWADQLVGPGGVLPQLVDKLNEIDAAVAELTQQLGVTVTVATAPPLNPALNDIWIDVS